MHLDCVTGHGMRTMIIFLHNPIYNLVERRKLCYLFQVLHSHFCCLHTPILRDLDCSLHSARSLPTICPTTVLQILSSQMQLHFGTLCLLQLTPMIPCGPLRNIFCSNTFTNLLVFSVCFFVIFNWVHHCT